MEKLIYYFNNYKRFICIGFCIVIVLIIGFIISNNKPENEEDEIELLYKEEDNIDISETIKVEIKGAVMNPGVYELDKDSRIEDAIKIAITSKIRSIIILFVGIVKKKVFFSMLLFLYYT